MAGSLGSGLVRIAVFFDGGYFDEVSRYYKYAHKRRARLSLEGIHRFIRAKVAECERTERVYCHIVESHYFRGRFSAKDASAAGKLEDQAAFDDVLIRAGIVQHYMPMRTTGGDRREAGIDVWLALEAFDMAVQKRCDVCALVVCDSDYVPLVRKLNAIGVRTMVLGWDFAYAYEDQGIERSRETRTSRALMEVCTYLLQMSKLINEAPEADADINGLFVGGAE